MLRTLFGTLRSMIPSKTRELFAAKLGQCPRCMRASARGALAGWAVVFTLAFAWPNLIALAVVSTVASSFTLLIAAHLVAYMVRVGHTLNQLRAGKWPGTVPCGYDFGRRTFIATVGKSGVAALAIALFGRKLAMAHLQSKCKARGIIHIDDQGQQEAGRLLCAGECNSTERCHIITSQNHHGGIRQWCGCKGQPEPEDCHVVRIIPAPGEGGGQPHFVCAGGCPQAGALLQCTPVTEVVKDPATGKPKYIIFTCECEQPRK